MRGLRNSLSSTWVFHLALSHVTIWVLLWFGSQKGSIFQVGSTERAERNRLTYWAGDQWKEVLKSIYTSLPSLSSISNSSLYFTGPAQCTAYSRCSVLLADIVQETGIKTIPMEKKCRKAKWLSEEDLQIAVKRRDGKSKGEKDISIWMQNSKEEQEEIRKPSSVINAKK